MVSLCIKENELFLCFVIIGVYNVGGLSYVLGENTCVTYIVAEKPGRLKLTYIRLEMWLFFWWV